MLFMKFFIFCSSKITEAVINQFKTLGHISNLYHHPKLFDYSKRLAEKMPGDLEVSILNLC